MHTSVTRMVFVGVTFENNTIFNTFFEGPTPDPEMSELTFFEKSIRPHDQN